MFDDFDFGDAHESEPNDYNPYESEADGYSPYDTNADSDASYLDDASEESQDGILGDAGDSPFSPAFGAAPSEEPTRRTRKPLLRIPLTKAASKIAPTQSHSAVPVVASYAVVRSSFGL